MVKLYCIIEEIFKVKFNNYKIIKKCLFLFFYYIDWFKLLWKYELLIKRVDCFLLNVWDGFV